ncbi:Trihelix transcription factor ASIL2 [Exaiptasia diaphana]|nr:Trihelix transcription factor ASIL2 [Exaiptasia diaphana]
MHARVLLYRNDLNTNPGPSYPTGYRLGFPSSGVQSQPLSRGSAAANSEAGSTYARPQYGFVFPTSNPRGLQSQPLSFESARGSAAYAPKYGFVFPSSGNGPWQPSQPDSLDNCASTTTDLRSENAATQKKDKKTKAADWSEPETLELIEAWGKYYQNLKGASNKEKTKIWNNIYEVYKRSWGKSERTLPQIKKRIQNLDYEFKNAKQRMRNTGEEGIKKIKEGFPYFDQMDDIMGHRDSVDPDKMELEGSSVFGEEPSTPSTSNCSSDADSPKSDTRKKEDKDTTPTTGKGKGRKSTRKRPRDSEEEGQEWDEKFLQMWEKSIKEDNAHFERCMETFQESQNKQMQQTNEILKGFQGIFKDLSKKD